MAGSSLKSVKPAGKRKMSRFNTDIVYFDLETTGFHSDAHILQIAAINYENAFNVYVKTKRPIDERASQHHGLRMVDGNLYLRNKLVKAYKIDQALSLFLEFLLIGCEPPVLLVAHNGNRFDAPRLVRAIVNNNMVSDFYMIEGFSDTLGIFKKKLPNRKAGSLNWKL